MIIWKQLSLTMSRTLRVRSSGSTLCRNYQRTKGSRNREGFVIVIFFTFNTVYCSVCSISLVGLVMLSIWAKLSSHVLTIQERDMQ